MTAQVAVITGAGGGIGRAVACELARAGMALVLVDRDESAAHAAADVGRAAGATDTLVVGGDVSESADVRSYVAAALAAHGRIDVLFNNAGIGGHVSDIVDYPEHEFDRVIAVNLRSVFLGLKYVLPVMLSQRGGSIVNTSSLAGNIGLPRTVAYNASKHGVIGLTKTAAAEVGTSGVRVNAICPGVIDTPLLSGFAKLFNPEDPDAAEADFARRQPMGRLGRPSEIASVVAFLASDAASYVNGVAWLVDGGALGTMSNPS